jgi:addiction module HigA family antidote
METYINVHPGEILLEEFMQPLGITAYRLSKDIGVQQIQISKLTKGNMGISAEMAMRLGAYFGTSAEMWLNLQRNHELRKLRHEKADIVKNIVPIQQPG